MFMGIHLAAVSYVEIEEVKKNRKYQAQGVFPPATHFVRVRVKLPISAFRFPTRLNP